MATNVLSSETKGLELIFMRPDSTRILNLLQAVILLLFVVLKPLRNLRPVVPVTELSLKKVSWNIFFAVFCYADQGSFTNGVVFY
jgi:hypothetical protein